MKRKDFDLNGLIFLVGENINKVSLRTEHLHNVRDFFTWTADNPENPVAIIKIKIGFGNTQMIGK